jgi:hypothetical protein
VQKDGKYAIDGKMLSSDELISYYEGIIANTPSAPSKTAWLKTTGKAGRR